MAEAKATRLNKVARELNVGINTIVDFLHSKGVKIDASPNSKVDDEVYQILLSEFQTEKSDKEKSRSAISAREKRETVTLDQAKVKQVEKEEEEEEIVIKGHQPVKPPETIKTKVEADVKLSVIGKIDLSTTTGKKTKKTVEKPVEKKAPVKVKKEEEKVEKPVEPVKEEVTPVEEVNPDEPVETIKADVEKLSGPKVMGKIDLPVSKDRKSLQRELREYGEDLKKKRKRKRINKVDVEKTAANFQDKPKTFTKPGTSTGTGGGGHSRPGGGGGGFKNKFQKGGQKPREAKPELSEEDIKKEIKETLARLSEQGKKSVSSKFRREKRQNISEKRAEELAREEEEKKILKLTEFVTVSDLAKMMDLGVNQVIGACMSLGIFASINQRIDAETIALIAEEFGYTVEFVTADIQETINEDDIDDPADLITRPPIVTVMGHVDHGKTSLLDYIRKANVIAGEAGGITQHIGAYSVKLDNGRKITFLDTPGHEAFTAMRARGAKVTDIAIIVIAADDSVKPQTVEAINHARAANVPMIFAFNKIDKPDAKPEKIRQDLSNMDILVEEWGGKFQTQEISAKKGLNIKELLEKVCLEADVMDLKANPNKNAVGTVVEAMLDKGRGYVATILVSAGTLRKGDVLLSGCHYGKIKAMFNERGQEITEAGPSSPVSILGLQGAPNAGDQFNVMSDEREAKEIATKRMQLLREQGMRTHKHITLDEIGRRLAIGDFKELNLIVKGDVDGSVEALSDSLQKLSTDKVAIKIVHKGVGAITEGDVLLASASNAIIVGFQVRPSVNARKLAETEEIDIRSYSIIYKAIEEIKDAMAGMLSFETQEKILGVAEIRAVFKISKTGNIAGCYVQDGKIARNAFVRLIRDGIVLHSGKLATLKVVKDDVKEVLAGHECGMNIDKFNDIKEGDLIECYDEVQVKQTL
ncbi:MAG TPA: translation initiation factor IF-2 [Flavobacteriales bacterium]|nr:translation initiation factor IF-2 [Flavobacteriales bacterium]